jgi:hypothetical protein
MENHGVQSSDRRLLECRGRPSNVPGKAVDQIQSGLPKLNIFNQMKKLEG